MSTDNRLLSRLLNRLLARTGLALVPRCGVKSLIEYANALEVNRPVGPSGASWLRRCASVMPLNSTDRESETVRSFREAADVH